MKALIQVSFAFDIEEEDLPMLSAAMEESIRESLLERLGREQDGEVTSRFHEEFEFYGCSISLRRDTANL